LAAGHNYVCIPKKTKWRPVLSKGTGPGNEDWAERPVGDDNERPVNSKSAAGDCGADTTEESKFTKKFGEIKVRDSVENRDAGNETMGDEAEKGAAENGIAGDEVAANGAAENGAAGNTAAENGVSENGVTGNKAVGNAETEAESGALDGNGTCTPAALPLGGGIPGASPRASVRCPATAAPGSKGGVALVRALMGGGVCEVRGRALETPCDGNGVAALGGWMPEGK
jgi:hypothetical protein